jgi:hypothetical protein
MLVTKIFGKITVNQQLHKGVDHTAVAAIINIGPIAQFLQQPSQDQKHPLHGLEEVVLHIPCLTNVHKLCACLGT